MPRLVLHALALLMAVVPVSAASYQRIVVGDAVGGCFFLSFSYPRIEWDPIWFEEPTQIRSAAPGLNGHVFAALLGTRIEIVELFANHTSTQLFSGLNGATSRDLVVDASGNVHVLGDQAGSAVIVTISASGALLATHPLGYALTQFDKGFDLAADQCTAFVGATTAIHRFNICSGTPLPDFVNVAHSDLSVLPDGGVLVAGSDDLLRYDSAGTLVNTIDLPDPPNALGLRNGGSNAVVQLGCDSGVVVDVDLNTEAVTDAEPTGVTQARAIFTDDVWTAALPAAAVPVPTLSPVLAVMLGAILVFFALRRLHS